MSYSRPAPAQTPSGVAPDGFRILHIRRAVLAAPAISPPTLAWGYDGVLPGPTLRVRRGQELRVRLVNGMEEPTAVHWHGVRLPNAMDGAPPLTQEPIQPGTSFDYRFTPPDAGTFWYHAGPAQTAQGLAGLLIVEESERVEVGRDAALMFQDAAPAPDAPILVNGAIEPAIAGRAGERMRLRLANAGERLLRIQIGEPGPDEVRTWVMAIDGQPAEPFLARENRVGLAPGNRIDLFVDAALAPGARVPILVQAGRAPSPVAHLAIEGPAAAPGAPLPDPKPLPANALPQRLDFTRALRISVPIEAATLLPPSRATQRPPALFSVRRGRVVVLALANRTEFAHVVHLHGHHARLLDRLDDGWKPFWLDTVPVEPRQTERIAFLADNPGKWAIDARALAHAGAGMVGWFEVT